VTADLVREHVPDGVALRDLGEYRLRDVERPLRIHLLAIWGLPANFPPVRATDARHNNLSPQRDRFIGREIEIADVLALLRRPGVRLVTLTGPGGVGKTRLALEVGKQAFAEFADGVVFVELAAITDAALMHGPFARALGVADTPGQPIEETVRASLRGKHLLVMLDNLEHLPAAAGSVRTSSPRARG